MRKENITFDTTRKTFIYEEDDDDGNMKQSKEGQALHRSSDERGCCMEKSDENLYPDRKFGLRHGQL